MRSFLSIEKKFHGALLSVIVCNLAINKKTRAVPKFDSVSRVQSYTIIEERGEISFLFSESNCKKMRGRVKSLTYHL